jgi:hypothetical protein
VRCDGRCDLGWRSRAERASAALVASVARALAASDWVTSAAHRSSLAASRARNAAASPGASPPAPPAASAAASALVGGTPAALDDATTWRGEPRPMAARCFGSRSFSRSCSRRACHMRQVTIHGHVRQVTIGESRSFKRWVGGGPARGQQSWSGRLQSWSSRDREHADSERGQPRGRERGTRTMYSLLERRIEDEIVSRRRSGADAQLARSNYS